MKNEFILMGLFYFLMLCSVNIFSGDDKKDSVAFTTMPQVKKVNEKYEISFEVSAATDVEVSVLNSKEKVIKHLAAGVLGGKKNPPSPLIVGFKQRLIWDGMTDFGKKAEGGPFQVRVRLGMHVKLDGFLDEKKEWIGDLHGLATDKTGKLYVYSSIVHEHRGHSRLMQEFDRDGKYIKTIMPMPANLKKEEWKGFNTYVGWKKKVYVFDVPGGYYYPRNYYGTWPEFYSGSIGKLLPRVDVNGILTISDGNVNLARINGKGACVGSYFFQKFIANARWNWRQTRGTRCIISSPDGKNMFLSGFSGFDKKKKTFYDNFPMGRIYKKSSETGTLFKQWIDLPKGDKPAEAGAADFDAVGNLIIFNCGTGKCHVIDSSGKTIATFDVMTSVAGKAAKPYQILCNRKTGDIYIDYLQQRHGGAGRSHYYADRKIIKYSSWKAGAKPVFEYTPPPIYRHSGFNNCMALDDSVTPAILWVGFASTSERKLSYIYKLIDQGNQFKKEFDLIDKLRTGLILKTRLAVHPETDDIVYNDGYSGIGVINGLSGKAGKLPFGNGVDMTVGLDGNWYIQTGENYSGPIRRFDKNFKPIPVANKEKASNALGSVYGRKGAGYCTVGIAADKNGRVFSSQMYEWARYAVAIFGPDGKPENPGRMKEDENMKKSKSFNSAVIGPIGARPGGLQLDYKGNIYMGAKLTKPDSKTPIGFESDNGYKNLTGSIIKFGPKGGAIYSGRIKKTLKISKENEKIQQPAHLPPKKTKAVIEGALKVYLGIGGMSGNFGDGCMCRQPMFQVDGWGRIFYPNVASCNFTIIDNVGNIIGTYGHYGNIDSKGPGEDSLIKTPSIPLGWPLAVGVSNQNIYIADAVNRRIVRLNKVYAATESIALP
ncbi:MAG: hypothetical protein COA79_15600 [Planctomycetota bacterium]|nr:MAG: hypothetical protein COA79_15600 [Planctomycetota bacterium]